MDLIWASDLEFCIDIKRKRAQDILPASGITLAPKVHWKEKTSERSRIKVSIRVHVK